MTIPNFLVGGDQFPSGGIEFANDIDPPGGGRWESKIMLSLEFQPKAEAWA